MVDNGAILYVRAVVHPGSVANALDEAGKFMMEGETVLNSIEPTDLTNTDEPPPRPERVTLIQCFPKRKHCDHSWPEDGNSDDDQCLKCGMLFSTYIHMEMP